jgi:hypothetical protein
MPEHYRYFELEGKTFAYKTNLDAKKGVKYMGKGNLTRYIRDVYKENKKYIDANLNRDAYIGNESTYKAFKRQVLDGVTQNPTIADLKKSIKRLSNSKVLIPDSFGELRNRIIKSRNFTSKLKNDEWRKFKRLSKLDRKTSFDLNRLHYIGTFDGQGSALYSYGDPKDKNKPVVYVVERKSPKKSTGASIEIYSNAEYQQLNSHK